MRAIILAAGQGTRLRPYTDEKPKCMVELAGRALLHHQIGALREAGVTDIVVVGGYRADRLDALGTRIVINSRYAETNMVSTLFCAGEWLRADEDALIVYGDLVYEPRVIQSLIDTDAPLAVGVDRHWKDLWDLRMEDPLDDAETLKLGDGDRIVELGKKPRTLDDIEGQYMGLVKVRGDSINAFRKTWHALDRDATYDRKDFDNMYMTSFLQHIVDSGWDVRAAFTDRGWLEVDTIKDLERYECLERSGQLREFVSLTT